MIKRKNSVILINFKLKPSRERTMVCVSLIYWPQECHGVVHLRFLPATGCALTITRTTQWGWPPGGQVTLTNSHSSAFILWNNLIIFGWISGINFANEAGCQTHILSKSLQETYWDYIVPALHFQRCFMKWEVIFLLFWLRGYQWDVDNKISSTLCAVHSRMKTSSNYVDWENLTVTRD